MQHRYAISTFFAAVLILFWFADMIDNESLWYGGKAIGTEAHGFDALVLEIFGDKTDIEVDENLTAMNRFSLAAQNPIVK
jgi:hypothetical protein